MYLEANLYKRLRISQSQGTVLFWVRVLEDKSVVHAKPVRRLDRNGIKHEVHISDTLMHKGGGCRNEIRTKRKPEVNK